MYQRLTDGPGLRAPILRHETGTPSAGRWDAAPDLERWLASFYHYFEHGGHRGIIAINLSHLAALAFTIVFSFVLLFFVDWEALLSCNSEETCRAVSLCYARPFHQVGARRSVILLCYVLFFVYWVFNAIASFNALRDAAEMRTYYKEHLGIVSDDILATMLWSEVVSRLVQQQRTSRFCIVQDELTVLEIANIIMREDNFMIALTNQQAFTSRLPSWIPPRLAHTRAVLWSVRTAIFRWAFDSRSRIREEFVANPELLARRLQWMGLLNLVLVLPVLIFVAIYFFMRHAEEFRSHRASPFRRQWTDYAKWTFREFNELPHQFSERMYSAQVMAEQYCSSTRPSSPVLESVWRFVKFVAGSILAVLLIVALWDDTPLLFVKIQEKNLLWYLAVFGFLFTVADSGNGEDVNSQSSHTQAQQYQQVNLHAPGAPLRMHIAMMRLARCTHHLPPAWRAPAPLAVLAGGCGGARRARLCKHSVEIRAEFLGNFFVHKVQALVEELVGVVLAPLLLWVYLPQAAPDIVDVMRRCRHASPNLGDWCAFGCLDPSRNGSDFYSTQPWLNEAGGGGAGDARRHGGYAGSTGGSFGGEGRIVSNGGKLEKSVISFILSHRLPEPSSRWEAGGCDEDEPWAPPAAEESLAAGGRSGWLRNLGHGRGASGPGDHAAIPLMSLGPAPTHLGEESEGEAEAPSAPPGSASFAQPIWGCPASAMALLRDLEDFQERELDPNSPHRGLYSMLPQDLLGLERAAPSPGDGSGGPLPLPVATCESIAAGGCGLAEPGHGGCGSHFFWLEVLYDFHSGRHASHLGDAGGGVAFELLEREHSPTRSAGVSAAAEAQCPPSPAASAETAQAVEEP